MERDKPKNVEAVEEAAESGVDKTLFIAEAVGGGRRMAPCKPQTSSPVETATQSEQKPRDKQDK